VNFAAESATMNMARELQAAAAFARLGRLDEARSMAEHAAASSPSLVGAWVLLAQIQLQRRQFELASLAAHRAIDIDPRNADALYVLGRVYKVAGQLELAEASYAKAADSRPDDADLLTSLGIVLRERGRLDAAIDVYQRALRIRPDHPQANHNLANALSARGSVDEAQKIYDRSEALLTRQVEAMRAAALNSLRDNRVADALANLEQIVNAFPRVAAAILSEAEFEVELAKRHLGSARLKYAEEIVRRDPNCFDAVELARCISIGGGLYERALRYSELAYQLVPSDTTKLEEKLVLPAIYESQSDIAAARSRYSANLDEILHSDMHVGNPDGMLGVMSFYLAYHGENDQDLQVKAAAAIAKAIPSLAMTAEHVASKRLQNNKIRVGFISRFFCMHSIGKTTLGLVEKLSRDRFEVFVLRITPSATDDMTGRISRAADHALVLDAKIAGAREQIAALELDILFFQDIGMEPTSYFLGFARLARVQCVSFGHPNTTGLPHMDYFVSNDLYELPDSSSKYSERLFLLRDLPTLAYYYRPDVPVGVPDRSALGLPSDAAVYICPQTLFKIHPDFDPFIRDILRRDQTGVVALISGDFDEWTQGLRQRFERTMADVAHRILFLPRASAPRFLQTLAAADVVLDTIHFNGMNSSLESFAVGTPVVTLPTKLQRGRHTQAMYRKMEILDCIANDQDDYVEIAVRLGRDREFAGAIRSNILARNHVLFENPRVVEEFERFFRESLDESAAV
jgi:predicted O-linked N-acetylglucosamine transferase (SPINDLY family)